MITNKAGMRELVSLDGNGVLLHGTYHKATGGSASGTQTSTKNLGMMFFNALSTPRSLIGDSGVFWATSFAARGYPSFRFDLPGLGDSFGELPSDLVKFANEGGYAAIAASKVEELVRSRGLSGVVIFAHCAGATTAIYAASGTKECKGLVLMDPYFNLPKGLTPKLPPELVHWARRSRVGGVLRAAYDRFREAPGRRRKDVLPANANVAFISIWKKVVSTGLPILILKAPQPADAATSALMAGTFDYLEHIRSFAVRNNQICIEMVEDTDHSFSNRAGREAVRQRTEAWLDEYFPQTNAAEALVQRPDLQTQNTRPVALGVALPT